MSMDSKNQLYILPFSARSQEALDNTLHQVIGYLKDNSWIHLADASWTLQKGRRELEYKKAVIADRTGMAGNHFQVLSGSKANTRGDKPELVYLLPEPEDTAASWKAWHEEKETGYLFKVYRQAVADVMTIIPAQYAEKVASPATTAAGADGKTAAFLALTWGYANVKALQAIGINPSALAGEGVAELTAMVCAEALRIEDAVDMIHRFGVLSSYEEKYQYYQIKEKQIPVMKRAGKKAKAYLEKAVTVKLSSDKLENSITSQCLPEPGSEQVLTLIGSDDSSYLPFAHCFSALIGRLWCLGIAVNWDKLNQEFAPRRISLPTYVFDKKKYESDVVSGTRNGQKPDPATTPAAPMSSAAAVSSVPGGAAVASVLKELWKDALGITDPGGNDDFIEKGGSSLDAIMLSAKIKERLQIDFPLSHVFQYSRFGRMEKYLREHVSSCSEDVIKRLEIQKYYEPSGAQKRMYVMNEVIDDALPYNLAAVYLVEGVIYKKKLQSCFSRMIQRHEAFRTRFEMVNGDVVQIIEPKVSFEVEFSIGIKENIEQEIRSRIRAFDLSRAPLLRVMVISLNNQEHILILDMHHIIADQSSLAILLRELQALYEGKELPEPDVQYKDFAKWQNDYFRSGKADRQLEYWKQEFAGTIPVLELYTDYDRPETMRYDGRTRHFEFTPSLNSQIFEAARQQGLTPFILLMAAIKILLWRYTGQDEIVIGTAVAGRNHVKLEPVVGMFVNTLAIKSKIDEELTVAEYLQYMKEKILQAFDNQDCQFDALVEALDIPKSSSRKPLFDVALNYVNMGTEEPKIEGLKLIPYENGEVDVKYDLTFTLEEKDGQFTLDIDYLKSLFRSETIGLMGSRLEHVIGWMLADSGQKLQNASLITVTERQWLTDTVNRTESLGPPEQTILRLFEQSVRDNPDKTALEDQGERLSYRQLNNLANQLAERLQQCGIGYGDDVLLFLERGYRQVLGMLGVMKLGAVYIPVDTQYPQDRVDYIIEDSKSKIVITSRELAGRIGPGIRAYLIDVEENRLDQDQDMGVGSPYTPPEFHHEDLLFILYTSGSTGRPKGTCVMHKNIIRVVKYNNFINAKENDRVVQMSNYVFDPSMFDFYTSLLNGATLVIVPQELTIDIPALAEFLIREKITLMCLSTALFHMLVDWKPESMKGIRKILVGGEQMSLHHARKAVRVLGKGRIINGYGPTETGIMATGYPVDDVEDVSIVPIGYPATGTSVYVVDDRQQLAPLNVAGELYIGGAAVSQGYLNQEELTAAKFIPFALAGKERVFCSGDRVVWNSKKELVFLGRKDFQVKIRGHRVELGEIERQIENVPGIRKAFVVTEKDRLETLSLIAYYTVSDYSQKDRFNENYLHEALSSRLPVYMIPSQYMLLEAFPLNHNGKIDRKALPVIAGYDEAEEKTDKRTEKKEKRTDERTDEREALILKTMKKILNVAVLNNNDDFFRCGGQSIKAIALTKELSDQGFTVKINDIFQCPTAAKLAGLLQEKTPAAEPEEPEGRLELNEIQAGILIRQIVADVPAVSDLITMLDAKQRFSLAPIQKIHRRNGSDYSGFVGHLEGAASEHQVRQAIAAVIGNNQLLHCALPETDDDSGWLEYELAEAAPVLGEYLAYRDISKYVPASQTAIIGGLYQQIMLTPYASGRLLWRLAVLRLKADEHLLIWGADHLIFDGLSAQVLKNQLQESLWKNRLPPPERYSDYVQLLGRGPAIAESYLVEQFRLAEWSAANQELMKRLAESEPEPGRQVKLVLPLATVEPADIWRHAFETVAGLISDYTGLERIPFALVDYGRSYQDRQFYNCVGEFLAMVPVLYDKNHWIPVEPAVQLCKDSAVNFVSLLEDAELKRKYPAVTDMLGKYFGAENASGNKCFDAVLYNFQGAAEEEEKAAFADIQGEEYLARITVLVNYDADHLIIEFHNLSAKEEEQLHYHAREIMQMKQANETGK